MIEHMDGRAPCDHTGWGQPTRALNDVELAFFPEEAVRPFPSFIDIDLYNLQLVTKGLRGEVLLSSSYAELRPLTVLPVDFAVAD